LIFVDISLGVQLEEDILTDTGMVRGIGVSVKIKRNTKLLPGFQERTVVFLGNLQWRAAFTLGRDGVGVPCISEPVTINTRLPLTR
jgi:hypothetical protein